MICGRRIFASGNLLLALTEAGVAALQRWISFVCEIQVEMDEREDYEFHGIGANTRFEHQTVLGVAQYIDEHHIRDI